MSTLQNIMHIKDILKSDKRGESYKQTNEQRSGK